MGRHQYAEHVRKIRSMSVALSALGKTRHDVLGWVAARRGMFVGVKKLNRGRHRCRCDCIQ